MQSHHHGHPLCFGSVDHRWGGQGKGVVHVQEVWLVLPNSLPHPPVGFLVPQGQPRLPPRGKTFQVAVVKGEVHHLPPPFPE
jgi:hypothetical protein